MCDLTLRYEALEVTTDVGRTVVVYTADPQSPARDAVTGLGTVVVDLRGA